MHLPGEGGQHVRGHETFTARFTPTDNVVDLDDPERDNKCEITIVDDVPNIMDIEVTSSPARDNDSYGVGETIEISATFSTDVDVGRQPGARPLGGPSVTVLQTFEWVVAL